MTNLLIEIKATVFIDWEYALQSVVNLSKTFKNRRATVNVLAEYGAISYQCATPPEGSKLAIVISPPIVYFCPSDDGLSGIFIEKYQEEKHGKCYFQIEKTDFSSFSNIHARLDGWQFFANMVSLKENND